MQFKFWVLCAPFVLATVAQAAPEPLPQLSSSSSKPDSPEGSRAPFSSITIASVRLGSRTVGRLSGGRIDKFTLFAQHGNPTAVVVPESLAPKGKSGPSAQMPSKSSDWASSITPKLDKNHVEWLYKRPAHTMGFVANRRGTVDAIVAAGTDKSVTLQAEGITGSIALGSDMRKVLQLFGYPSTIESYGVPPAKGSDIIPSPRTFELRYNSAEAEAPTYVVFTIRDNRVVRFYAFAR